MKGKPLQDALSPEQYSLLKETLTPYMSPRKCTQPPLKEKWEGGFLYQPTCKPLKVSSKGGLEIPYFCQDSLRNKILVKVIKFTLSLLELTRDKS